MISDLSFSLLRVLVAIACIGVALAWLIAGRLEVGQTVWRMWSAVRNQRNADEADMAILRERLADDDVSGYIPHAEVAADVNA